MAQKNMEYYPAALTIAGSDSGGGAGIQADLRTFSAFGVYGSSVITAVTAQNPHQVKRVDPLNPEGVKAQLDAVLEAFSYGAVKTGMLFSSGIIDVAADAFERFSVPLVVDPVMISTSGAKLLEDDAIERLQERILPRASWITPNVPEAEVLTDIKISNRDDMLKAARTCSEKWNASCVLKGGHAAAENGIMTDIVFHDGKLFELSAPEVPDTKAAHGTGCTLSAAIAAALALGLPWKKALRVARGFVFGSLAESVLLSKKTEAMYPPSSDHSDQVDLKRIK